MVSAPAIGKVKRKAVRQQMATAHVHRWLQLHTCVSRYGRTIPSQLHSPTTTAQNHNQHGRAMPCSMLSLYIPLSLSHPPYRTLSNYICISCSLPLPVYPSLYLSAYPSQPPLSHPLLAPPQSASSNMIYMGTCATHVSNSLRIIRCALGADSKFHI